SPFDASSADPALGATSGRFRARAKRLRPFVRREFRSRLISAMATVAVLVAMAWLGASALTSMDTRGAHELRSQLGIESYVGECGGSGPMCTYDDAEQRAHDQVAAQERRVRTAISFELERRIETQISALTNLRARVDEASADSQVQVDWTQDEEASAAVYPASDLRPLATQERESIALAELRTARRSGSSEFLAAIDWRLN